MKQNHYFFFLFLIAFEALKRAALNAFQFSFFTANTSCSPKDYSLSTSPIYPPQSLTNQNLCTVVASLSQVNIPCFLLAERLALFFSFPQ
jgi:hypothetical protein